MAQLLEGVRFSNETLPQIAIIPKAPGTVLPAAAYACMPALACEALAGSCSTRNHHHDDHLITVTATGADFWLDMIDAAMASLSGRRTSQLWGGQR